jgi:hypothetical protein
VGKKIRNWVRAPWRIVYTATNSRIGWDSGGTSQFTEVLAIAGSASVRIEPQKKRFELIAQTFSGQTISVTGFAVGAYAVGNAFDGFGFQTDLFAERKQSITLRFSLQYVLFPRSIAE